MQVRLACESDLPSLVAISEAADSAAHWTPQQWRAVFRLESPRRSAWIAHDQQSGNDIGFLVALQNGPDWELENIAVLPIFRRHGTGTQLVSALLTAARSANADRILLEVRASNLSGRHFYAVAGFKQLAYRKHYYQNPAEDALILVLPLTI